MPEIKISKAKTERPKRTGGRKAAPNPYAEIVTTLDLGMDYTITNLVLDSVEGRRVKRLLREAAITAGFNIATWVHDPDAETPSTLGFCITTPAEDTDETNTVEAETAEVSA